MEESLDLIYMETVHFINNNKNNKKTKCELPKVIFFRK
jgi:hypothetical protein